MLFSKRKELEQKYYSWLRKQNEYINDCPYNVITFLDIINKLQSNDLINKK